MTRFAIFFYTLAATSFLIVLNACEKSGTVPDPSGETSHSQVLLKEELASSFGIEASNRLLTIEELEKLTPYQARIMKNSIYARHGYVFKTADMEQYFAKQPWYEPNPNFNEADISRLERENLALIKKFYERSDDAGSSQDRRSIIMTWGARLAESVESELWDTEYELFDVDADGDRDAVALYRYSPYEGNHFLSTIAVFENLDEVLVYRASASSGEGGDWATNKIVKAANGTITCKTDVWLPNDGLCCPSGQGTVVYRLQGRELWLNQ